MSYGDGNPNANIMLIGEAWGEEEERVGRPFVGRSGEELNRMLHEVGIMRSETYATNLINERPPYNDLTAWIAAKKKDITSQHVILRDKYVLPKVRAGYESLMKEIGLVRPNVIVALGNHAMWALTGQWGIMKWRGSQLTSDNGFKVIPTIHPAAILREYSYRPVVLNDLRRAGKERNDSHYTNIPSWDFTVRPSYHKVISVLEALTHRAEDEGHLWVEFDLETSPVHITCAGISWSKTEALCIPFTCASGHYWSEEEEGAVVFALYKFLTNPKVWVRGQNLLYDCQHTYRWWHFVPNVKQDTMISHHVLFAGMKKSLDFQASLYCDHYEFWKEMHRDLSNKAGA
jgi:uracil-DNA glycosylase family 4